MAPPPAEWQDGSLDLPVSLQNPWIFPTSRRAMPMDEPTFEIFEFAGFTLVPGERLLIDGSVGVPLAARTFDLLLALVQRAGRLATKDARSGRIVEDVNLSVNISLLRRALARPGRSDGIIRTVPKAGYRFVAPVTRPMGGGAPVVQHSSSRGRTAGGRVAGDNNRVRTRPAVTTDQY